MKPSPLVTALLLLFVCITLLGCAAIANKPKLTTVVTYPDGRTETTTREDIEAAQKQIDSAFASIQKLSELSRTEAAMWKDIVDRWNATDASEPSKLKEIAESAKAVAEVINMFKPS